ncbi:MAG: helix-turn-helix domain-containing protein [Bacteroidetes bacterium]|nr:helix-turn-helix domain-containing protein [Bacteroidota bacterium]
MARIRKTTPKDIEIYVDKSYAIIDRIYDILERKGLEQKVLAKSLNKYESEISKWLKGDHNFTIQTLSKIEAILGEEIIHIPTRRKETPTILLIQSSQEYVFNLMTSNLVKVPGPKKSVSKSVCCFDDTNIVYNPYGTFGGWQSKKELEEVGAN